MRIDFRLSDLALVIITLLGAWPLIVYGLELLSAPPERSSGELYMMCLLYLGGICAHTWIIQRVARSPDTHVGPISAKNHSLSAYLAGGTARLIQVSLMRLTALESIALTAHRTFQRVGPLPDDVTPLEELIYYLTPEDQELSFYELELRLRSVGALDHAEEHLAKRGLIMRGEWRRLLLLNLCQLPQFAALILIELAPDELLDAHLPYLNVLDVNLTFGIYLVVILWIIFRERSYLEHTTTEGERWLKLARQRLKRRPIRDQADLKWACQALALGGVKALRNTEFYPLAQLVKVRRPWLPRPSERTLLEHVLDEVEMNPFDILNQDY